MNPWPIPLLGTKDLDFAIVNYDFTSLTADQLGPLPPLEGFMDSTALDLAASIADQAVLIDSMAGDLDDLGNIFTEMDNDGFDPILADLAGIAASGDTLLNNLTTLVG